MPELKQLQAGHAPAVLAFELANRAYFAAAVSDRGDEFFDRFTERHSALLAAQEAGTGAFYVLVAEDGSVLGRFNLYELRGRHRRTAVYRIRAARRRPAASRPRTVRGAVPAGGGRGTGCAHCGPPPPTPMPRPGSC